ncbi:LacI family DNA-binding transcriptional regulator [Stagnihabitans tardus]|nr:LacI family DNA-binding transcriptional regulator [Stagnihabitans tardus]
MADGREEVRVTIRTVAADAGVSVAAVSKVLRNAYGVSDSLRGRVEASIEKLGYRPSVAARGMRGQTFTLGVLLVEIANPFLPSVYHGIESITDAAGYKIMVGIGAARAGREAQLIEQMIDNRMDGLILVASQISGETLDRYARQIPTVVVGHHEPTAQSFDTINSDDFEGARMVVRALCEAGHRDIAMLAMDHGPDHSADVSPQRESGYRSAMTAAGLVPRVIRVPPSNLPREAELRAVLTAPDRPRAVFCWSDLDAVPLLNLAHQLGIRVPHDLAIVGYDNSPVAALPLISLASVDQDGARMGKMAAQALLSRIGGRTVPEHRLITPRLVPRASL